MADALVELVELGAVVRETREAGGRQLRGFGLLRSVTPLRRKAKRSSAATAKACASGVAKRERPHRLTAQDDLRAIASVASRGDGERRIAEALVRRGVPCSAGRWHHVKVHRRIDLMRAEVGITTTGMRAGDVVARWRAVAEGQERRRAAASEAAAQPARINFGNDERPRP